MADRVRAWPDGSIFRLTGDELILLKASRGVALERALPHLLNRT